MAYTIKISVGDLAALRADLESVELGLGRALNKAIREAAGPITARARELAPYDPAHRGHPEHDLPHIRDSIAMRAAPYGAAVFSKHPGGPVWEFGGTIAPRGREIQIPARAMARTAGEQKAADLERTALRSIAELLERHNL